MANPRQMCRLATSSLNHMMKTYSEQGSLTNARQLFDQHPSSRNLVSWNIILAAYLKHDSSHIALQLFDEMPLRDIVSWNTLFTFFHNNHDPLSSYHSYLRLQTSGFHPNHYTFSILLSSFSDTCFVALIPQLHAQLLSLGYHSTPFVASALMRGYSSFGDHPALCHAFHDVLDKTVGVWNAFILGHMEFGLTLEAQIAFSRMPLKNVVSWTTMMHGYLKNNQVKRARSIFDKMDEKNVITWTAMISGYVRLGKYLNALDLFLAMTRSGTRPNEHTFSSILAACAAHSELVIGKQLHVSILKHGIADEVVVLTSLVDMYAKCGNIEAACCIFETMPKTNLASWNTIIGGFARHGLAKRAINGFEEMISSGIRPDKTTFVHVLSACGHGGEVVEGERIFDSMKDDCGVEAEKEHYACMVHLYGRAGHLEKAERLIKGMPFEPDVVVWGALLGACAVHSNSVFSSYAAEAILKLEKDNPAAYSLLSKIYAENGVWGSLTHLKINNIKTHKAGSWIG
ncbi:hypothetical protein RND81_07G007800 [Saponaria officinalis]|uniref:Pentatricopeptide repeat-containing protein n=1 Tax=Saponaria officinalis TaxID=3572 RepID=A0AAW1JLQ4_SAPOF